MPILPAVAPGMVVLVAMAVLMPVQVRSVYAEAGTNLYEQELARIDRQLGTHKAVADQRPDSWLQLEQVAQLTIERARLTGDFNDYVAAQNALSKAFTLAGEHSGPVLTRAKLNFSIHQLPAVEADLIKAESALLVDAPTLRTIEGLRADVLFYTAQYIPAKSNYDRLESSYPSVISSTRLAHYYATVGEYVKAEDWLQTAEKRVTGSSAHLRSWLKLQLGILDLERGRLDDALNHYQQGLAIFPGYWLLEEHIAEIDVLQGRDQTAEDKYRDLIQRTGSPLFMSELANILAARTAKSDHDESLRWHKEAVAVYTAMMNEMPALMSGHALEYFLYTGDVKRAVQLAQYNFQLRPGGPAALRLVQAYAADGQSLQAENLLESVLKSPFRSAELYATAGVLYRARGDLHAAEKYNALAGAINPTAVKDINWLRSY